MRILLILPNWLGDAVMATAAIESLCECFPQARLTVVGSPVSVSALKYHPMCTAAYVDKTKKSGSRLFNTYRFAKKIGKHDAAISFRNQLHASLLLKWTGTPRTIARGSWHASLFLSDAVALSRKQHLVRQYQNLVDVLCGTKMEPEGLRLFMPPERFAKPTLGINPGATYGSAKRWYPDKFAAVAAHFADRFDIIIFGGPNETEMAADIEKRLIDSAVTNYQNLAGNTTIEQLCAAIGGLSLFITNDSGPMHVAAAYRVPTVAVFGPTRHLETSPWKNPKSVIVRHEMACAPCMKRECPLKHHECMKSITAEEVIEAAETLL